MNEVSEQDVVAFVDGRLEPAESAAFEARLASDPALARRVEAHRWMTRQIIAAYGPPEQDIDDAMVARLGLATENVAKCAERREARRAGSQGFRRFAAMAATLAIGVLVGNMLLAPQAMLAPDAEGHVVAQGQLAEALSGQLAGQAGAIRIGLSLRTKDGFCRTFSLNQGASGLACREGSRWTVPIIATDRPAGEASEEYRLAGGTVAPQVMAEVDRRILGQPLSPAEEKARRQTGWH